MLLTLATTHAPATQLGFLLHKHPERFQSFELTFGKAHVFYTEANSERCEATLLLEIDPVRLVRGTERSERSDGPLEQYVNDRPYVASSFLSVAIAQVFGTALSGQSKGHQELADSAIPLEARLFALPCRGGEAFLRRLFEPLGYELSVTRHPLDERFPEWGESSYYDVKLRFRGRLRDLLTHLYVLVPVLDDEKHYYVGQAEVEKLLRVGEGWLASHPERESIAQRYLKHSVRLTRAALSRLVVDEAEDPDEAAEVKEHEEEVLEERLSLADERMGTVVATLKSEGARRVLDLGCGGGRLLARLLDDTSFEEIVGVDASCRALEVAERRLHLDRLPERKKQRIRLLQGALTYRDARLAGFDAAAVVEVIEHLDLPRLSSFARVLFECARPRSVVMTTPNVEYNVRFEKLPAGRLRHRDHRFEWTRAEFEAWCVDAARRFGYAVRFAPIGPLDSEVGAPTQMAVFTRVAA
ncbi:MAG: 3' terminal RNA ribose 2'-O-methyltransferase Hen1 [Acidobacteria bacterium]|nr:3' terminal RNA ribose 2'-O-methyltransferase Hen1 [Acidobacteriota bacterium]